jgi:hypothetical protein
MLRCFVTPTLYGLDGSHWLDSWLRCMVFVIERQAPKAKKRDAVTTESGFLAFRMKTQALVRQAGTTIQGFLAV